MNQSLNTAPIISIVVPVYNVELYLSDCLKSLREQTFQDIEIICVNDGSKDDSLQILTVAASCDPRIRIISKANGGLSSARNAGIQHARGRYIMFVDSDDFLVDTACQRVFETFTETEADLVVFGINIHPPEAGEDWVVSSTSPRNKYYSLFHPDIVFKEQSKPFAVRTACSTELLRATGILFDETVKYGEDMVFLFMLYPRAKTTAFISDKLYWYRYMRDDSLMATRSNDMKVKVKEHFLIIKRVMTDWRLLGLLETYPVELLNWALHYVLYDIRVQERDAQVELLKGLRDELIEAFCDVDLLSHPKLNSSARQIYVAIIEMSFENSDPPISNSLFDEYNMHNPNIDESTTSLSVLRHHAFRNIGRKIIPRPIIDVLKRLEGSSQPRVEADKLADTLQLLLNEYDERKSSGSLYPVSIEKLS